MDVIVNAVRNEFESKERAAGIAGPGGKAGLLTNPKVTDVTDEAP